LKTSSSTDLDESSGVARGTTQQPDSRFPMAIARAKLVDESSLHITHIFMTT
jgi:hypothetical protein